jgi:hypothetical protein
MGTSRNDRSPDIPPWKPALAVVGRTDVPTDRQLAEIWRAAFGERGDRLRDDFSQSSLVEACRLANQRIPVQEALRQFDAINQRDNQAGLATEFARRALARCSAADSGSRGFIQELFGEATVYYVSRDLPSFVAAENRVATNTAAIKLKQDLQTTTKQVVDSLGEPPMDRFDWSEHVGHVLSALTAVRR